MTPREYGQNQLKSIKILPLIKNSKKRTWNFYDEYKIRSELSIKTH